MAVLLIAGVIAVAILTGVLAEHHGYNGSAWFVLGLIFPGLALLIVLFALPGRSPTVHDLSLADAVNVNPTARHLATHEALSAHAIARATGRREKDVVEDLKILADLEAADRDGTGRWSLTSHGRDLVGTEDLEAT